MGIEDLRHFEVLNRSILAYLNEGNEAERRFSRDGGG
jgi:hypothetical protein